MRYGATGMQGWRNTMEDSHIAELDLGNGVSFFGVYDGHGGECERQKCHLTCDQQWVYPTYLGHNLKF